MNLSEYLYKNKITREAFAQKIGYSKGAFSHIMNCQYPVTKKFAKLVEMITEGEIKSADLIKRSKAGMKRRAEQKASEPAGYIDNSSCYGICKMCKKKLNEMEL